jgi:murein DD-endopeptidase MepM/ murein hydrolase activator NlpD
LWPWTRQRASSPRLGSNAGLLALALGAIGALGLASGASAAPADEKARVDQRLESPRRRLRRGRARGGVPPAAGAGYSARTRALEARLAPLRARSARLEQELDPLRTRLAALSTRLATERARLKEAEATLSRRQELLGRRLRDLYVRGEPDPVLVLVESGSLAAAVEATDLVQSIANRDGALARSVSKYADETRATRDAIAEVRADVAASETRAQEAAEEAIAAKADLETQRAGQTKLLAGRRALLARVSGDREDIEAEAKGLAERSAELGDKIREAQGLAAAPSGSVATGSPSASGMVWPVSGTLTSGFGPRWGRMHEGIDIAGGSGTPIAAAAAGTVILAGWNGGYGNMVVVDHGGGISTAYGHMSSISVSAGQSVGQGTVVGGMGTTGHSTGVHLHFEVRVNGAATNPLNYL